MNLALRTGCFFIIVMINEYIVVQKKVVDTSKTLCVFLMLKILELATTLFYISLYLSIFIDNKTAASI